MPPKITKYTSCASRKERMPSGRSIFLSNARKKSPSADATNAITSGGGAPASTNPAAGAPIASVFTPARTQLAGRRKKYTPYAIAVTRPSAASAQNAGPKFIANPAPVPLPFR